jgi:hypothetical protein
MGSDVGDIHGTSLYVAYLKRLTNDGKVKECSTNRKEGNNWKKLSEFILMK